MNRNIYATIQEEYPNGAPDSRLNNFVTTHNTTSIGQFYQVEQEMKQLMAMDLNSRLSQVNTVRAANNAVQVVEPYEQYEQTVHDIFLQTLAVENLDFSEIQKNTLLNIASLCSYESGAAVFKARSLYLLIDPSIQFNNICSSTSTSKKEASTTQEYSSFVQIFPNPANQLITIRSEENGKINITSIVGKVVYQGRFNKGDTPISTNLLANGLYVVKIESEDGTIYTQKIVVNH